MEEILETMDEAARLLAKARLRASTKNLLSDAHLSELVSVRVKLRSLIDELCDLEESGES